MMRRETGGKEAHDYHEKKKMLIWSPKKDGQMRLVLWCAARPTPIRSERRHHTVVCGDCAGSNARTTSIQQLPGGWIRTNQWIPAKRALADPTGAQWETQT